MALTRDERDIPHLLRSIRHEIAQNRTDIQRLWRLVAREQHEPFFIIGGETNPDGSISGSGFGSSVSAFDPGSGNGYPPGDNESSADGGPDPNDTVAENCCLWIWDGTEWIKSVDKTAGCTCPTPPMPGTAIQETVITCCPDPSGSSSSSGDSGCEVLCYGCAIPCQLHASVSATGPSNPLPGLVGTHALTWDGTAWVSGCISTGVPAPASARIRATCQNTSCKLNVAIDYYVDGGCATWTTTDLTTCTSFVCQPIDLVASYGAYEIEVTE